MRGLPALLVLSAICLAAAARGQEADPRIYAPPSSDRSATAFACTVETLLSGVDCILEGQAEPAADVAAQARENGKAARALADRACRRAARLAVEPEPDRSVLAACRREFEQKASGCADGAAPMLDAEGRFGAAARPCYAALSQVLARARTMAAASAGCCRCLAAAGCARSGEACNQTLVSGGSGPLACMARRCTLECRAWLPEEPPEAPPPREPAPPAAERSAAPRKI